MSNASLLSPVNTVFSPKVSVINNSYKSAQQDRKYKILLAQLKCLQIYGERRKNDSCGFLYFFTTADLSAREIIS